MLVLERALRAPVAGRTEEWADEVTRSLLRLRADFEEHIVVTEGPDGLYQDVLASAPRLANAIQRLHVEHDRMSRALDALVRLATEPTPDGAPVDLLRERAVRLLGQLVRHRQRGADLVFEAYETDIGGET